jgi:hypothetical protein
VQGPPCRDYGDAQRPTAGRRTAPPAETNGEISETDCVAGHVRFELRNVAANYPFERSHKFPEIQPNSGRRDYSRLSCGVAETQLGPSARISAAFLARALAFEGLGHWEGFLILAAASAIATALLWAAMPETIPAKYLD